MAHFAELSPQGEVIRVIVVNDDVILDGNGQESEELGVAFCKELFGDTTQWVQTSFNGNRRFRFAGPGMIYNQARNVFTFPRYYPSWRYDTAIEDWLPPRGKEKPEGPNWVWNEQERQWVQP